MSPGFVVRPTTPEDFPGIIALCRKIYPDSPPWKEAQLRSHLVHFPGGQRVADAGGEIIGMAASLILRWHDYDPLGSWRDFTAGGTFENHDPSGGRTLYGAEVMVAPDWQGHGVGGALYAARRRTALEHHLLRIRAGARLRGYGAHAHKMSAADYVRAVVSGKLRDPTLSFQLNQGFRVIDLVEGYLGHDPESLGNAAVIEWLNEEVATPAERSLHLARAAVFGDPSAAQAASPS
ncbi:MAG: GNAT family N-acetyltransferase [Myxococcota bacterium]|nr:GNAT family N-acetyltransferase [Myxococcota bacterium]